MGKTGSKTKINLINSYGIPEAICNCFKNEVEFKVDIYNCVNNTEHTEEILKVVNKHSKLGNKWTIYYQDELLLIFRGVDTFENKKYLHIEFN